MKSELERAFEGDMLGIYKSAKKECGYNATRFLKLISDKGGLEAARQLIAKEGGTDGFTTFMRVSWRQTATLPNSMMVLWLAWSVEGRRVRQNGWQWR